MAHAVITGNVGKDIQLKQSGDVPDEVMDLCRTRWAELEGEK